MKAFTCAVKNSTVPGKLLIEAPALIERTLRAYARAYPEEQPSPRKISSSENEIEITNACHTQIQQFNSEIPGMRWRLSGNHITRAQRARSDASGRHLGQIYVDGCPDIECMANRSLLRGKWNGRRAGRACLLGFKNGELGRNPFRK